VVSHEADPSREYLFSDFTEAFFVSLHSAALDMPDVPINANIMEVDGPYYQVRLTWLPRVGDIIDLHSYLEQHAGKDAKKWYEVVQVVHQIHDVTDKVRQSLAGHHWVNIHVRNSNKMQFQS
jgi:hypothetical protein